MDNTNRHPSSPVLPQAPANASESSAGRDAIYPIAFLGAGRTSGYLRDPSARALLEFFQAKGLAELKREDGREQWYSDWIAYQRQHGLYAAVLSPAEYSSRGHRFDLLRYTRFIELFGYCSPAHGYSLQVSFLGLFSILMGSNAALKQEAVGAIEAGELLAFGVSEKDHGSDLLANEFVVADRTDGGLAASGAKYYIGNTDTASIISILARRVHAGAGNDRASRAPFMFIALRPNQSPAFRSLGKIRTFGVRAANVGSFAVVDHPIGPGDIIAEGRNAWDAMFGTITLGKFFLGFGSIGIGERALEEAVAHLGRRMLYGKPALDMPHLRSRVAEAYARLTAMKLYAYRTLDYVHAASAADRRYLLFCAVQKAKVSTEGQSVIALLRECIGAKGFESDTYFEMALRDIHLIPSLEGSMHINLGLALQFVPRYFDRPNTTLNDPPSLVGEEMESRENLYLMEARTGAVRSIGFPPFLGAYQPLMALSNVELFARQCAVFREIARRGDSESPDSMEMQSAMALGACFATVVYGQLVAENAARLKMPEEITSAIFSVLVGDLTALALQAAAIPQMDEAKRALILEMCQIPKTTAADWDFVGQRMASLVSMDAGEGKQPSGHFSTPTPS